MLLRQMLCFSIIGHYILKSLNSQPTGIESKNLVGFDYRNQILSPVVLLTALGKFDAFKISFFLSKSIYTVQRSRFRFSYIVPGFSLVWWRGVGGGAERGVKNKSTALYYIQQFFPGTHPCDKIKSPRVKGQRN